MVKFGRYLTLMDGMLWNHSMPLETVRREINLLLILFYFHWRLDLDRALLRHFIEHRIISAFYREKYKTPFIFDRFYVLVKQYAFIRRIKCCCYVSKVAKAISIRWLFFLFIIRWCNCATRVLDAFPTIPFGSLKILKVTMIDKKFARK